MKTIKILLALLMVMLGTTAFAQDVVVTKTDGTTETIENADSVVYDVKILGYYSFAATTVAGIKELTASDFTKLTSATSEVPCGVEGGLACVLTEGTTAPNIYKFSAADNMYGNMGTMKQSDTAGKIKNINGKTYNVWYVIGATGGNISKCKFIIN